MLVGYARVSTDDQDLSLQRDALHAAGCDQIFEEQASGAKAQRPGLTEALAFIRSGDTLVVWRLDRLGRSLSQLIALMTQLEGQRVGFRSLTEHIDTTTSGGRLIFHIFGALAEFERNLIRERTLAGLTAARARGRHGGRPRKLDRAKQAIAIQLYQGQTNSVTDICKILFISRSTLYRSLRTRTNTQSLQTNRNDSG